MACRGAEVVVLLKAQEVADEVAVPETICDALFDVSVKFVLFSHSLCRVSSLVVEDPSRTDLELISVSVLDIAGFSTVLFALVAEIRSSKRGNSFLAMLCKGAVLLLMV